MTTWQSCGKRWAEFPEKKIIIRVAGFMLLLPIQPTFRTESDRFTIAHSAHHAVN